MNGALGNAMAAQALPGGPAVNIATPINDVQLVSLVAAQLHGSCPYAKEAVEQAMEIVAEAVVQMEGGQGLQRLIRSKAALRLSAG